MRVHACACARAYTRVSGWHCVVGWSVRVVGWSVCVWFGGVCGGVAGDRCRELYADVLHVSSIEALH